jgi:hypothetical protein
MNSSAAASAIVAFDDVLGRPAAVICQRRLSMVP